MQNSPPLTVVYVEQTEALGSRKNRQAATRHAASSCWTRYSGLIRKITECSRALHS
jgi:hypothetical protein